VGGQESGPVAMPRAPWWLQHWPPARRKGWAWRSSRSRAWHSRALAGSRYALTYQPALDRATWQPSQGALRAWATQATPGSATVAHSPGGSFIIPPLDIPVT